MAWSFRTSNHSVGPTPATGQAYNIPAVKNRGSLLRPHLTIWKEAGDQHTCGYRMPSWGGAATLHHHGTLHIRICSEHCNTGRFTTLRGNSIASPHGDVKSEQIKRLYSRNNFFQHRRFTQNPHSTRNGLTRGTGTKAQLSSYSCSRGPARHLAPPCLSWRRGGTTLPLGPPPS